MPLMQDLSGVGGTETSLQAGRSVVASGTAPPADVVAATKELGYRTHHVS